MRDPAGLGRRFALNAVALLLLATLTGCVQPDRTIIAVLPSGLPGSTWSAIDGPAFDKAVAEICEGCEIEEFAADATADDQRAQVNKALAADADVLLIEPVDVEQAEQFVGIAGKTPLVAYGRLVPGFDHAIAVDPAELGSALVTAAGVRSKTRFRMIDPPADDADAASIMVGVSAALDDLGARASRRAGGVDAILTLDPDAAVEAAAAQGKAKKKAPVYGVGGGLEAFQRLILGSQAALVSAPTAELVTTAADVVVGLVTDAPATGAQDFEGVPSWMFEPTTVTTSNLTTFVVGGELLTLKELCEGVDSRCRQLGLT